MKSLRIPLALSLPVVIFAAAVAASVYFGWWIPNERAAGPYAVRGIDVSHHQGKIDWSQVRKAGVQFAYLKATEGDSFRDDTFQWNFAHAAGEGVVPGAYHFYRLGVSGEAQARLFIEVVPVEKWSLPPAVDLEFSGYNRSHTQDVADFQRDFGRFCQLLSEQYHRAPVLYVTADFRARYLASAPVRQLWVRNLFFAPAEKNWTFWQFTNRGRVPGIAGFVDLNVFNGSRPEFDALRGDSR